MVPHHQTLTALTASAGLEGFVLGKINWCHFQQLDQDSWHNNKPIVCMCVKKTYSSLYYLRTNVRYK